MNYYNKHYIRINESNNIIYGFSDAFSDDPRNEIQSEDICINEQGGRQFILLGKINPSLSNECNVPLYKWDGKKVVPRSDNEIAADMPTLEPPQPTEYERLEALENAVSAILSGNIQNNELVNFQNKAIK